MPPPLKSPKSNIFGQGKLRYAITKYYKAFGLGLKTYTYMNAIFRTRHIFVTVAHLIRSIVLLPFWYLSFTCLQIAFPRCFGPGPELTFSPTLAPLLTVAGAA